MRIQNAVILAAIFVLGFCFARALLAQQSPSCEQYPNAASCEPIGSSVPQTTMMVGLVTHPPGGQTDDVAKDAAKAALVASGALNNNEGQEERSTAAVASTASPTSTIAALEPSADAEESDRASVTEGYVQMATLPDTGGAER